MFGIWAQLGIYLGNDCAANLLRSVEKRRNYLLPRRIHSIRNTHIATADKCNIICFFNSKKGPCSVDNVGVFCQSKLDGNNSSLSLENSLRHPSHNDNTKTLVYARVYRKKLYSTEKHNVVHLFSCFTRILLLGGPREVH